MITNEKMEGLAKLKEAFKEINRREYENLHVDDAEEVVPSPDYLRRMRRLIREQKRTSRFPRAVRSRVAAIAIALVVIVTCSMTVSAIREPIVEFFTNIYERFVECFFCEDDMEEAPSTIETVYVLGTVPDGYVMDEMVVGDLGIQFTWINENGEKLILSQVVLNGYSTLDAEESSYRIAERNGKKIAYTEKHGIRNYFWNFDGYAFMLTASGALPEEDVLVLIDSLTQYN